MDLTPTSRQLGCGRDIDEVWADADKPPNAHELTCPYCTDARSDLARLTTATRSLREEELADPELLPSPQLTERILAIARAEVRRGRRLPLDRPGPDRSTPLTVSEQAVATVIRRVGDRSGLVEIRHCAVRLEDGLPTPVAAVAVSGAPDLSSAVAPSDVRVSIRVSVGSTAPIPTVIGELRTGIIDAVRQEVGINVLGVDAVVEDVHDA